jgi:hypothetical protein
MDERPVRLVAVGGVGLGVRFDVERPASAGETALARSVSAVNGGKASNQAIGASVFGADAALISAIGRDEFAPLIRDPLVRFGVDIRSLVEFPEHHSMVGAVMVDERGENYITLAPGALAQISAVDVRTQAGAIEGADVCVVSLEIAIDAAAEALRTEAKIFYHSCGSIVPMIPLLIAGGVDAIHPVQPRAEGMGDREMLKREFGADITFWGAFDQQDTLPFGTPDEVRSAARELFDTFMPGGGFVFAAGHNIQADVPPENILALFDAADEFGVY